MLNPPLDKDILIVGQDKTGKTALAERLAERGYSEHYRKTVAANLFTISDKDGKPVQVWDLAGDPHSHRAVARLYYGKAHVVMLVLDKSQDVAGQKTQLEFLKEQQLLIKSAVPMPPTFVLAITKSDIAPNAGALPDQDLQEELGVASIVHCSAKANKGINEVRKMLQENLVHKQVEAQQVLITSPALTEETFVNEINKAWGVYKASLKIDTKLHEDIANVMKCLQDNLTPEQKLQNFQKKYSEVKPLIAAEIEKNSNGSVAVQTFQWAVTVILLQDHCKRFIKKINESRDELLLAPISDHHKQLDKELLEEKGGIVAKMLENLASPLGDSKKKLRDFQAAFDSQEKILTQKTFKDNITLGFLIGLSVITAGLGALAIAVHTYVASDKKHFGFWKPKEVMGSKEMDKEIKNISKISKK